jgi:hypothetical protein
VAACAVVTTLRRRLRTLGVAALAGAAIAACGSARATPEASESSSLGAGSAGHTAGTAAPSTTAASTNTASTTTASASRPPRPVHVTLPVDRYPAGLSADWQTITTIAGKPAMWITLRRDVTLVRMDQSLVHLALHAGSVDPGGTGWHYGDAVAGREIHHLILGINGGFKFSTASGGFLSYGRVGLPLSAGYASIVTYTNGTTQIGAWDAGVPAPHTAIASVRQNLHLLIDHGVPATTVANCGATCWGATIGGQTAVARSGLGIRADGQLVWAGGEGLTVSQLADGMVAAGVERAVELDINPAWVAGYLYVHHRTGALTPVPVVPGQLGIYGHLLTPYSRDFFTVLSN